MFRPSTIFVRNVSPSKYIIFVTIVVLAVHDCCGQTLQRERRLTGDGTKRGLTGVNDIGQVGRCFTDVLPVAQRQVFGCTFKAGQIGQFVGAL